MASLPKIIGVVSCGLLLSLGSSTVAQTEIFDAGKAVRRLVKTHTPDG